MGIFVLFAWCLTCSAIAQVDPGHNDIEIQLTFGQLLGEQQAEHFEKIIPADETVSWQIYLPDNYSTSLPGVLVYVSPTISGQIDPRWKKVMDQQNLIYISADRSGNRKPVTRRMVLATMAIKVLARQYAFNDKQVLVSGFSGGGRVASKLATQYPEVFSGSLYICGVDFWKKSQTPRIERVIENRFVFMTGSKDFNRTETRQVYRKYLKAGAENSTLMDIPSFAHELPNAKKLTKAISFLQGQTR